MSLYQKNILRSTSLPSIQMLSIAEAVDPASRSNKGLKVLAKAVATLMDDRKIKSMIDSRVREFIELREKGNDNEWFSELSFCIMTANSSARLGMRIQSALEEGCLSLPQKKIEALLSKQGHRFSKKRAEYIFRARNLQYLVEQIESYGADRCARDWLVENVLGLGYKEASHLLRNTGHFNVAILDRHILRLMKEYHLIPDIPKSLTRKRYMEVESILEKLSGLVGIPLGILDLYLWYMKTGEVLK